MFLLQLASSKVILEFKKGTNSCNDSNHWFSLLQALGLIYLLPLLLPLPSTTTLYFSQLSPCGHPANTDTRYYGQNSDPHL